VSQIQLDDPERITVMIADDHAMVRLGLRAIVESFADLHLVGEASDGKRAVQLCEQLHPNVILMDVMMPMLNGIEATRQVRTQCPATQVIAITSFEDEQHTRDILQAGAMGFLLKNVSASELAAAIRSVHGGQPVLSAEATRTLLKQSTQAIPQHDALSERERDVLRLMIRGMTNAEIGEALHLSPFTVKNHVSNIIAKLGASTRTEAATMAVQQKLV
jgi:two-component system, NarL family, response regulator LiaR